MGEAGSTGRRAWLLIGLGLGVMVVIGVSALGVVQALQARTTAEELRATVTDLRQAASGADAPRALDLTRQAGSQAEDFLSQTSGPQWRLVEAIPGIGGDIATARIVATAVEDLASAADPLLDVADQVLETGLRLPDGRFDITAIASSGPALSATAEATRRAEQTLRSVPDPATSLGSQAIDAAELMPGLARRLDDAAGLAEQLPGMLGADGPRTWAVLLQNPTEIRGSGGFVGGYAFIRADDGRVTLLEADSNAPLSDEFIPYEDVADPGQIATWGGDLSRWNDYNLSLDFPFVGELTAAGFADIGTPVDGVFALDQRVVAALLSGTGPVTALGETIDTDNAEAFLSRDIYAEYPVTEEKDAVVVALLRETFEAVTASDLDLVPLARALAQSITERRVLAWSADPNEEEWLQSTRLGGALPDAPGHFVGIALNNSAGNKLDAYVTADAKYVVGICPDADTARSQVKVILRNDVPDGLPREISGRLDKPKAPPNSTSLLVHIYGPQGAGLAKATVDGAREFVTSTQERGHPVWGMQVSLDQGQTRTIEAWINEPARPDTAPELRMTPLLTHGISVARQVERRQASCGP